MYESRNDNWRKHEDAKTKTDKWFAKRLPVFLGMTFLAVCFLIEPVFTTEGAAPGPQKEVLNAILDNGLRVVIVRNTLAPVVTTMMNYLVGSLETPPGFPGTAHAQEHMMFRGSPGLSADQLAGIIAAMGGKFNADTQQTITQYFLTVPSVDLDVALHIEAIRMRGVLDSERLWAQERGAIEQEVAQDYSSPEFIFYTKLLAAMFKGTSYEESPLGSVASFDKTTGAMLKKFHETWYVPNNAVLVIVGDVDPQVTLGMVKKYFSDIPRKDVPARPEVNLQPVKPATIRLDTDESYGLATVAFRLPGYDSPDYPACLILADVLSSQRGSLFALVPQGKALYAGFSLDTMAQVGLGYAMAAFPLGGDGETLVTEMQRIVEHQARKGFPEDLIKAARLSRRTKMELKKTSILGLAMAWSEAVTLQGKESPQDMMHAIERVSVEDVNRVARKYLDPHKSIVTILKPQSSGKPIQGKPIPMGESVTLAPAKPVTLPEWAEKALKRLEIPDFALKSTAYVLSNGLRVIVQPETVSDTVSLYGRVRNNPDMQAPEGKKGVHEVLEQLFSYGSARLDRVAFQRALDEIGAEESAGADFGLQVLSGQFERGVELLADNLLNPALPNKAFKVVRQQVAAMAAGKLQSPKYRAEQALKRGLFPQHDPALRETIPKEVLSLTPADVRTYSRRVFRPDVTTIVIIGKVTPEKAKQVVDRYFGAWKAKGPAPETFFPPIPDNKPSISIVPDLSRTQAKVTLAQTLGLTRSNPDYYALELGNHVLGGAFYATRLYRDLREEAGLVYYVAAEFDFGVKRSAYAVSFGCDPKNAARASAIVTADLLRMRAAPVTADELDRAKALLLREIPLSQSSVDQIARQVIYLSTHLLPLDEPIRAAHKYVNLTSQEVQAAFKKWLRPGDFVEVIEGPPQK